MIAGEQSDIALREDERIPCAIPETILLEPRAVIVRHSTYGGPTIRVAKGLGEKAALRIAADEFQVRP
jgi:hypothetical protein